MGGSLPEQRIAEAIGSAAMPYKLATAVIPILKRTPEYARARRERRSQEWLQRESVSLGHALAEVVQERLGSLEP